MAKGKGKKKAKKAKEKSNAETLGTPVLPGTGDLAASETTVVGPPPAMSKKEFEKEMEKLQVELVKMQE